MKTLQIKPHFRVEIVEPKHVYLLSETSTHALNGELYCQLIPLLDGNHTLDEIIHKLQVDPSHIDYALERLQAKGYLTETFAQLPKEAAVFWGLLKVEPQVAYQCLQQTQVYVSCISNLATQPLITALEAVGIKTSKWDGELQEFPPHSLLVVLTDDYLQPELSKINQIVLKTNQPWLLIKPVGTIFWLGPIFHPEKTGCWECLAHRLRGNREVEASVLRQKNHQNSSNLQECLPPPAAAIPSTLQTALNLATTEIAKWIIKQGAGETTPFPTLEGKALTFDQTKLELQTHILSLRPQCPSCGDSNLVSKQVSQPITLSSRKKHFTSDGGHRAVSPDQTVNRYKHLISPITGVVTALVRASDPNDSLIHTYNAVHSMTTAGDLEKLRRTLIHKSAGKGKTDRQSKASGFCEAIERYSGIYQGDEPRISATFAELAAKAIHPGQCLHFSLHQYQNREELNQKNASHNWIYQPFDETKVIEWTPVWSLTEQTQKYFPTALCYYGYSLPEDHNFGRADSNGNAAGNTLEEAVFQGFFELVERDGVGIWWYNRLKCPGVDLASFNEPYLLELQELYRTKNRDLWVLDITTDLNIPVFVALSRRTDGKDEKIIMGFGAHLDPKIGILRAVTEMNQLGLGFDFDVNIQMWKMKEWMSQATLENQPYLAPDSQMPPLRYDDYQLRWSDDIYQDVITCVEIAKNAGLETLLLDQTRPDIGLNVVKVIVPGLRHFWWRLAPGRLYDVPVKIGKFPAPLTEEQLNPIPMPFV
ncbi:MAG: TOMM precursor leader peptide-binding protein [Desmonostoc vinosum HA7617-LM4]|jgi:ribosomal protein S12 methylthiotransferase accessory factor|nr:TOMM precursor leader peptide-binding protein [Desmonostoc vinosum HA7617-LM4]